MTKTSSRQAFLARVKESRERNIDLCRELVAIGSENPPGDTGPLADTIAAMLADVPGIIVERIVAKEPAVNLVARLAGGGPGRRLVFNGHLDTFPVGDAALWTMPPLGGEIRDGCMYGRGVSDMKAGVAAALLTVILLADFRDALRGEAVLTFVGDEETGGRWGTQYLLDNVPAATGDAMINGDAGSPWVMRFGEKGQMWIAVKAEGKSNHAAHVHLGVNAIERLTAALPGLAALRDIECPIPEDIRAAIVAAKPISEEISGAGEAETLQSVTLSVGVVEGGSSVNIIPDSARALCDIRFPPGLTVAGMTKAVAGILARHEGVEFEVLASSDSYWSDPADEIFRLAAANSKDVLGREAASNMRVGMSDARFYRQRGIPTLGYGAAPHNMGGPDEYITLDDLYAVFYVHATTAFDYLSKAGD